MNILQDLDMDGVKVAGESSLLPNDIYLLMITESETKENSQKTGHYLELTIMAMEPAEFDGVTFKDRLSLDHPNDVAVKIAKSRLKGYFDATGGQVADSSEMHSIPFFGKVVVVPAKDEKGFDSNKITKWWPYEDDPRAALAEAHKKVEAVTQAKDPSEPVSAPTEARKLPFKRNKPE